MKFIALKTKDGELKGDIFFYCRILHVSRQGFYQYLANKDRPWKYQPLADAMMEILEEDKSDFACWEISQTLLKVLSLPTTPHKAFLMEF